jgi:hypothetical protein
MATKQEQEALDNLGANMRRLAIRLEPPHLGKILHSLIAATVKAALPGRQSEANTKAIQQAAQKAFARKLSRKIASL